MLISTPCVPATRPLRLPCITWRQITAGLNYRSTGSFAGGVGMIQKRQQLIPIVPQPLGETPRIGMGGFDHHEIHQALVQPLDARGIGRRHEILPFTQAQGVPEQPYRIPDERLPRGREVDRACPFQLARQMGQAELAVLVGDRVVGSPKIGDQGAREGVCNEFFQGGAAAAAIDQVHRGVHAAETSQPVGAAD